MRWKNGKLSEINSENLSKLVSNANFCWHRYNKASENSIFHAKQLFAKKNFSRYVTSPSPIHSERKNNSSYSCVGSPREFSCVRKKRIFMNKSFPIDCVFSCCPTVLNVTFIFLENSITPVSDNNSQSEKLLFSLVFSTFASSQICNHFSSCYSQTW